MSNISLQYQYIVKYTGDENKENNHLGDTVLMYNQILITDITEECMKICRKSQHFDLGLEKVVINLMTPVGLLITNHPRCNHCPPMRFQFTENHGTVCKKSLK